MFYRSLLHFAPLQRRLSLLYVFCIFHAFVFTAPPSAPQTISASAAASAPRVTYAVNCGGPRLHSAIDNVTYNEDTGYSSGIVSDAGKTFSPFPRVEDDVVYRTERYDLNTFSYEIPIIEEGTHTITLKFSEVYFDMPGGKVFNVKVGGQVCVYQLDIFSKVGKGVPHDEYVEVTRTGAELTVNGVEPEGQLWDPSTGKLTVEFLKLPGRDNPKVNAIVVHKAGLKDVPKLQPYDAKPIIIKDIEKGQELGSDIYFDVDADDVSGDVRNAETIAAPGHEEDDDTIFEYEDGRGGSDGSGVRMFFSVTVGGSILLVSLYCMIFAKPTYSGKKGTMTGSNSSSSIGGKSSHNKSTNGGGGGNSQNGNSHGSSNNTNKNDATTTVRAAS